MTNVTVNIKKGNYLLKADGHATGSPEVCAAVSGLIYALDGFLLNYDVLPGEAWDRDMKDGHAWFSFRTDDGRENEKVKAAFMTCAIGLEQIALVEPEYLKAMDESEW